MSKRKMETAGVDEVAITEAEAPVAEVVADTPGNDENNDGLKGGTASAETLGDVLKV